MDAPTRRPLPYRTADAPPAQPEYVQLAGRVTEHLVELADLPMSFVSRVSDECYAILGAAADAERSGLITDLPVMSWRDSMCFQMWHGYAPRLAPDTLLEPEYADNALREAFGVRAYVGAPIVTRSAGLVGTLCAVGLRPMRPQRVQATGEYLRSIVEAKAQVLGFEFEREMARLVDARAEDWSLVASAPDALTGLPSRSGWRLLLGREEQRALALSEPLGVLAVDVPAARTVRQLRRTAGALVEACGTAHVTRIAPKRFAVLAAGLDTARVAELERAVVEQLTTARLAPIVGSAMRLRHGSAEDFCGVSRDAVRCGAEDAWHRAEQNLLTASRSAA